MKILIDTLRINNDYVSRYDEISVFKGGRILKTPNDKSTIFEFDKLGTFEVTNENVRRNLEIELKKRKQGSKDKHKAAFIETVYKACGDMGVAIAEYEGSEEDFDSDGDYSDPVGDAKENMSCWSV